MYGGVEVKFYTLYIHFIGGSVERQSSLNTEVVNEETPAPARNRAPIV
jgi:hypothetical protein